MPSAAWRIRFMTEKSKPVLVTVLAHNEEARIALCLDSLPLDDPDVQIWVVVNGSSDSTAEIVRGYAARGVRLVDYAEGGKSRSWNRFVLDDAPDAQTYVFVDGDAQLVAGSVNALRSCLEKSGANAASAVPMNGRNAEHRPLTNFIASSPRPRPRSSAAIVLANPGSSSLSQTRSTSA